VISERRSGLSREWGEVMRRCYYRRLRTLRVMGNGVRFRQDSTDGLEVVRKRRSGTARSAGKTHSFRAYPDRNWKQKTFAGRYRPNCSTGGDWLSGSTPDVGMFCGVA